MVTVRKIRLQMTPEDICIEYRQAKDPSMQIKILSELNGCDEKDIRDILIDFGALEGGVSGNYSRNTIYVDGKLRYPSEDPQPKKKEEFHPVPKENTTVPLTTELKEIIRKDLRQGLQPNEIAECRKTSKANVYRIRKQIETEMRGILDPKEIRMESEEKKKQEALHKEANSEGFYTKREQALTERWETEVSQSMKMLELFLNQIRTNRPSYQTKERIKETAESLMGDIFDHVPHHLLSEKGEI